MSAHELRYSQPAADWNEALPIGNGNLGAMCFGDLAAARLQLNDDTAWSGSPLSERRQPVVDAAAAREALAVARDAVCDERYVEAGDQLKRLQHRHSQSYLPFADLLVSVSAHGDGASEVAYSHRVLDLRTATHTAAGRLGGVTVVHESWTSGPHGVLVHEVTADAPVDVRVTATSPLRVLRAEVVPDDPASGGRSSIAVRLQLPSDVVPPHDASSDAVEYSDEAGASLRGAIAIAIEDDGDGAEHDGDGILLFRGVRNVRIVVATATTFTSIGAMPDGDEHTALAVATARVHQAVADGKEAVRAAQRADHAALYDRVELELGAAGGSRVNGSRSVDVAGRLESINDGTAADLSADPELAALLFHYGRYLLICSSRPGSLPANLQGIWNDSVQPAWSSNYTTNINVQMNYWAADTANLAETLEPYFDLVAALAESGTETAARLYGAPGWVAHHNTDAWAYTQPVGGGHHDPKWAFWPLAGLWLARHHADHAEFGDRGARLARAFPVLRSATEFTLAWLQPMPDGTLGTVPSTSPENDFRTPTGVVASVAASSTLDITLVRDHLTAFLEAAEVVGEADDLAERARSALHRLPEVPIGGGGTVTEWLGDFEQVDPHHRHLSPLVFLYPGTRPIAPALIAAATRLLDERGDESTGWSLAWKIALRARLGDAAGVDSLLKLMFRDMAVDRGGWVGGLYPNLLAAHPPFQIDGNLGYLAGVVEALLQSHRGVIELLPAVPAAFGAGRVRGLMARPGVEVDLEWRVGPGGDVELATASFRARSAAAVGEHRVRMPSGSEGIVNLPDLETSVSIDPDGITTIHPTNRR